MWCSHSICLIAEPKCSPGIYYDSEKHASVLVTYMTIAYFSPLPVLLRKEEDAWINVKSTMFMNE